MKNIAYLVVLILAVVLIFFSLSKKKDNSTTDNNQNNSSQEQLDSTKGGNLKFPGVLSDEKIKNKVAVIETDKGTIKFDLYADKAPKTVSNFVYLTELGFYNGLTFHRVEPGFVAQGGDPEGTGTGGPGYQFEDETVQGEYIQGSVAMANSGPNTGGSQFFINLVDNNFLDTKHPVFGKIIEGMDVIDKIAKVQTGTNDKPVEDVIIKKANIVE